MSFESLTGLAFIQQIGIPGMIAILVIALIVFGKRLPDVARSLGKGIVEFKKGVRGIEDEVETSLHDAEVKSQSQSRVEPSSSAD